MIRYFLMLWKHFQRLYNNHNFPTEYYNFRIVSDFMYISVLLQFHIQCKEKIAYAFFIIYDWVCKKVKEILWSSKKHKCQTIDVSSDPKLLSLMGHRCSGQMDKNDKGITSLLEQRGHW